MTERVVLRELRIAWNNGAYVDESAHLVSASGDNRLWSPEAGMVGGKGIVDACRLVLRNGGAGFRR